jgi:undecaprenyl phosphate-alpha-L-ara4N flippase subunit ArnE
MNSAELGLCLTSLVCSSVSQLFIKGAALPGSSFTFRRLTHLGAAGSLQLLSIGLVVLALQTLPVSQLVPFAAGAYLLVPLGSRQLFGDCLHPRFWLGALLIISGILCTQV